MSAKEFALAMILLPSAAAAGDHCGSSKLVSSYLDAHPDWRPVETSDLVSDDRALWRRYHRGLCPGVAVVNFGDRGTTYVLALVATVGNRREKLIALRQTGAARILSPSQPVDQLSVVWRLGPGKSHDYNTGRTMFVAHDSAIYEVMESSALQFYWSNGAFHTLQTAD